uniref:NADH-ubiquinone oxidoreductase chain 6 n=1 Tax=Nanophyes marmoratus TaxID=202047 RepID=J9PIN0_9CUCU|nr:NADH dehydrogenase subunit 6 [Nanophyes marmoratus]
MLLLMMMMSLMFMFFNHPLTFGSVLLCQTILTSLITGLLNYNYWFSYILFLIMVGGMLILFIYMTSVAANEKFMFSSSMLIMFLITCIFITMSNFMDNYLFSMNFSNYDQMMWMQINLTTLSVKKFLNFPSNLILMLIITHLLITLIAVVKIAKIQYGPLRQMF